MSSHIPKLPRRFVAASASDTINSIVTLLLLPVGDPQTRLEKEALQSLVITMQF